MYRRQLKVCEPWETLIIYRNLDPTNPISYCQSIFKTLWNVWIFHKMYVFRDNIFYLNAYWVSFVIMLNERCSLYSGELGSTLELNRILINRSKDANSEGLVELPGTSGTAHFTKKRGCCKVGRRLLWLALFALLFSKRRFGSKWMTLTLYADY